MTGEARPTRPAAGTSAGQNPGTDPTQPARVLRGLPRRTVPDDPTVARLLRSHRSAAAQTVPTDATADDGPNHGLHQTPSAAPGWSPGAPATAPAPAVTPGAPVPGRVTESVTSGPTESAGAQAADPQHAEPAPDDGDPHRGAPKYLTLVRREARVHDYQAARLTELTRALNDRRRRGRSTVGERITDNTLVRVAIDLLLTRADDLAGVTEDDLRASLGLPTGPR
jgi:hypothetical protein